jgi:hypothetical protein
MSQTIINIIGLSILIFGALLTLGVMLLIGVASTLHIYSRGDRNSMENF